MAETRKVKGIVKAVQGASKAFKGFYSRGILLQPGEKTDWHNVVGNSDVEVLNAIPSGCSPGAEVEFEETQTANGQYWNITKITVNSTGAAGPQGSGSPGSYNSLERLDWDKKNSARIGRQACLNTSVEMHRLFVEAGHKPLGTGPEALKESVLSLAKELEKKAEEGF